MRSGWWKVKVEVTLDGASYDFNRLPQKVKQKIAAQMKQGAVAGAFEADGDSELKAKEDQAGVCPVCGGELRYTDNEQMDNGGVYHWICEECGATGKEGYDEVFDGHYYEVRGADGNEIPGREF